MKKVLSVAMASAMVLGMGANAFAIQYNVSSSDSAEWPEKFRFAGELFVTDKDGKIKEDTATAITTAEEDADFAPGDVIWMPMYADHQLKSEVINGTPDSAARPAVKNLTITADVTITAGADPLYKAADGSFKKSADATTVVTANANNNEFIAPTGTTNSASNESHGTAMYKVYTVRVNPVEASDLGTTYSSRFADVENVRYYYAGNTYSSADKLAKALVAAAETDSTKVSASVDLKEVKAEDGKPGDIVTDGTYVDNTVYTGNIDKDWSINLIEKDGTVKGLVDKAELYKATAKDAKKYDVVPGGVYLKVSLKDKWESVKEETVKYYVYVSENKTNNKTENEVWVSGTYKNNLEKEVSFTWTNNANTPAVWVVPEGAGNGEAVFDYNDKAFFTVKMYEGEKLYLDLGTAYNRIVSNDIYDASGAEVDSFFEFVTADANFSREGTLVLVSDNEELVPYKVLGDGEYEEVEDYEYVKDYAIAHTNEKVNGFVFKTKELGNYILSEEIVVEEEVEETPEEPAEETPAEPETPVVPDEKPNPNTGAEDFVGLAVSLAVVSVAAAGALALKK